MEMFLTGFALSLSACLDLGIVNVATIKRGLDGGVRAAFFVVGANVARWPDLIRRIDAAAL